MRPVRIPVQVTSLRGGASQLREATVIEFGGVEHAIFLSALPLEFDDRVRLEAVQEGRRAEATDDGTMRVSPPENFHRVRVS